MSFIGRQKINIPPGVQVSVGTGTNVRARADATTQVVVEGPLGTLTVPLHQALSIHQEESLLYCRPKMEGDRSKPTKTYWGTTAALLKNAVEGVSIGFGLQLNLVGVGYRAKVTGQKLQLKLGYSQDVTLTIPNDVEVVPLANTKLLLRGIDKQAISIFAAKIRQLRFPEPYKGKGILFENEVIRRKDGKKK